MVKYWKKKDQQTQQMSWAGKALEYGKSSQTENKIVNISAQLRLFEASGRD